MKEPKYTLLGKEGFEQSSPPPPLVVISYYNPQPLYTATQDCTAKANATLRLGESVRAACTVCEVWRPETPAWTRDPRDDPSGAPVAILIGGAQKLYRPVSPPQVRIAALPLL